MTRTLTVAEVRHALAEAVENWWSAPTVELGSDGFGVSHSSRGLGFSREALQTQFVTGDYAAALGSPRNGRHCAAAERGRAGMG
jgi:hypothetical protein